MLFKIIKWSFVIGGAFAAGGLLNWFGFNVYFNETTSNIIIKKTPEFIKVLDFDNQLALHNFIKYGQVYYSKGIYPCGFSGAKSVLNFLDFTTLLLTPDQFNLLCIIVVAYDIDIPVAVLYIINLIRFGHFDMVNTLINPSLNSFIVLEDFKFSGKGLENLKLENLNLQCSENFLNMLQDLPNNKYQIDAIFNEGFWEITPANSYSKGQIKIKHSFS